MDNTFSRYYVGRCRGLLGNTLSISGTWVTLSYQNMVLMVVDASSSLVALYLRLHHAKLEEADKEVASVRYQKENTILLDHQCDLADYIYKLNDISIIIKAIYLE